MSRPTQVAPLMRSAYLYRTFTVYGQTFQTVPVRKTHSFGSSYYPDIAETMTVWALPLSIATTQGIEISFSSSGY